MSIDATLFVTFIAATITADFIRAGLNTAIQYVAWRRNRNKIDEGWKDLITQLKQDAGYGEEPAKTEEKAS